MTYRIQHILEYGALRTVTALINALPLRVALGLAAGVARVAGLLARKNLRRAEARVAEVFGGKFSADERRRIVRRAWRTLFFNAVEILRFPQATPANLLCRVAYDDPAGLLQHVRAGHGAIIAVAHLGNWDLAGIASQFSGMQIFFLARRQKNPLLDAYLNRMRGATGVETVLNDPAALRGVVRKLQENKVLAMLPDVRVKRAALAVDFLGGSANIGRGLAVFARSAKVPIFPCGVWRTDWTHHHLTSTVAIRPDFNVEAEADERRMTREVMAHLSAQICAHPEQYFWFNKRWVLEPMSAG